MSCTLLHLIPKEKATVVEDAEFAAINDFSGPGLLWLDFLDSTGPTIEDFSHLPGHSEQVLQLLDSLEMDNLDKELILDARRFPKAELLSKGRLYLRLPTRNVWDDDLSTYLCLVADKNFVITIHASPLMFLEKKRLSLLAACRQEEGLPSEGKTPSPGALFMLQILEGVLESNVEAFLEARAQIEEYSDILEDTPDAVPVTELSRLKHMVSHRLSQCEDSFYCLTVLRALVARHEHLEFLRMEAADLLDDFGHLQRSLERLEKRLGDQLAFLAGLLQTRTGQRLRVLTLISAIFMPLSLIAGIYGMNFEHMPELAWSWAYYAVLGLMFVLAMGMVLFFRKRGWFR